MDLSSKLKNQEELIKHLTEQVGNRDEEISNLKAQSQRYSLDVNKSFKA